MSLVVFFLQQVPNKLAGLMWLCIKHVSDVMVSDLS